MTAGGGALSRVVLALLTLVLAIILLANSFAVFTPDTKPEIFLNPAQTAVRFASSWLDTPNLGAPNFNVGVAPVAAIFAILDAAGVPPWLTMRLWRFGLLVLGAWGARLVLREVMGRSLGRHATVASTAAAVAYAANPYIVVGGATTPTMLPYACLPWLVVCWLRGFRAPSWRWAAAAALVLAAMSGLNAGVVPLIQLIVLVPLLIHAVVIERHALRTVVWLVVRTGLIFAVLSAYWLVPALKALSSGESVTGVTESMAGINMANSFPEVVRGLGMWTLYGAGGSGWFDPGHISYFLAPLVVILSFGGPVIAALGVRLSTSPGRLFGAVSVLVGALVMVGTFPHERPSLWGRVVGQSFDSIPGLIAFRTTNKAGAVLELGMAVLIGLGAAGIAARSTTLWARSVASLLAVGVVAGSVFPALTGDLYQTRMDVPKYWNQAAQLVNSRGADSRVLMVPGTGVPAYSWGYTGPDEIGPSLFRRPFVFRSASPSGAAYASNLLMGVDMRLHEGTLPPGTVSTLAAYVGAGDVVGRYDLREVGNIGERVEQALTSDSGLGPATGFGSQDVARGADSPATVRQVVGPVPATSALARPANGSLVVDGAGAALPSLQAAGLLGGRPGLLLGGMLSDQQLADAVRDEGRVVLTDSNMRREASNQNPASSGPLLTASEQPSSTRALFDVSDQTVAAVRGNARITTSGTGMLFGPQATGSVIQAFDGDRTTGWEFGNFGTGVGNAVHVRLNTPTEVGEMTLAPMQGGGNHITTARVIATIEGESVTKDVTFGPWNTFPARVDLGPGRVSAVSITVTGVDVTSNAPVGFSEISIPGVLVRKVAVLPTKLVGRLAKAAEDAGVDPDQVPLDVVMRRSAGDANGSSTEEHRLERQFTVPARDFSVSGTVRLAGGISDRRIDELAGGSGAVVADSSSRIFNNPNARASLAFDNEGGEANRASAWVPNDPVVGEWLTLAFPERRLSSFTITQGAGDSFASKALVSINDGEPFEVELGPDAHRVVLPAPAEATRVRILITERQGSGFVRFEDVGLARTPAPSESVDRCAVVGSIDGKPLRADVGQALPELLEGKSVPFTSCDAVLKLDEGRHDVGSIADFAVDDLRLASREAAAPDSGLPGVEVLTHTSSDMTLRITGNCSPCLVSSGQSFDPGWTATAGAKDLGKPLLLDAFAAGWRVNAAPGDVIHISYTPAKWGTGAWLVSTVGLLACCALLAFGLGRRTSSHTEERLSVHSEEER